MCCQHSGQRYLLITIFVVVFIITWHLTFIRLKIAYAFFFQKLTCHLESIFLEEYATIFFVFRKNYVFMAKLTG